MPAAGDSKGVGEIGDKLAHRFQLLAIVAVAVGAPSDQERSDAAFLVGEDQMLDQLGIGRGLGVADTVRYLFGLERDAREPAAADDDRARTLTEK